MNDTVREIAEKIIPSVKEKEILAEIIKQENALIFDSFTYEDAFKLGMTIYELAKARNLPVAIQATKNHQIVFHAALDGTAQDNDEWLARKARLVNRMGKSSLRVGTELRVDGVTIEEAHGLTLKEYAAHGGCFPVKVKGVGMVGTIAVSGLEQHDDHALVIEGIKKYLSL